MVQTAEPSRTCQDLQFPPISAPIFAGTVLKADIDRLLTRLHGHDTDYIRGIWFYAMLGISTLLNPDRSAQIWGMNALGLQSGETDAWQQT